MALSESVYLKQDYLTPSAPNTLLGSVFFCTRLTHSKTVNEHKGNVVYLCVWNLWVKNISGLSQTRDH